MEAKRWKNKIKKEMIAAGTYSEKKDKSAAKSYSKKTVMFESVISTFAEILEERDRVRQAYIDQGSQPLVVFTSDRGAENKKPNPLLKQWTELNNQALTYWRDLGLTPAGLKRINEEAVKERKMSPLEEVLNVLEG